MQDFAIPLWVGAAVPAKLKLLAAVAPVLLPPIEAVPVGPDTQ